MGFWNVLRQPHLAALWVSQLLSVIGDHLFVIAATWVAVQQAGSSAALVTAAGSATSLVFGLLGGVYADRWNRQRTMIGVDVLRALAVATLPVWVYCGGDITLWQLVAVTVVVQALSTFFNPAMQASLPVLCRDDKPVLHATNALLDSTHRLARVFGPGMTGAFLLVIALPDFFTLDAVSYLISALVLTALGRHFANRPAADAAEVAEVAAALESVYMETTVAKRSLFAEITAGLRLLKGHRELSVAFASLGLVNMAWSATMLVGVPLLANETLDGSVGAYGLIGGAYGVGNLISLFTTSGLSYRYGMRMMFVGQLILGAGFLVIASAHSLEVAMLGAVIAAFGSPIGDLIMLTVIQTDFPSEHIGKIYSLRQLIAGSGLALGSLFAVPLFPWLGIPVGLALCACFIMVLGALTLLFWNRIKKP